MRVLFLNPPFHPRFSREQRSPAVTKSGTLYYPKWLAHAAGVAIKSGHDVDFIDAPAAGHSVQAVIDRKNAGVNVRVMLNPARSAGDRANDETFETFEKAGVNVQWASPKFYVTHEKSMVVDGKAALVATFNLCEKYFSLTRDYGIITEQPHRVAQITEVFEADWQHLDWTCSTYAGLLWSNSNSRYHMAQFIDTAVERLDIQHPKYVDAVILDHIAAAADRGVRVHVLCGGRHGISEWDILDTFASLRTLRRFGVKVHKQKNLRVHAKLLIADDEPAVLLADGAPALVRAVEMKEREAVVLRVHLRVVAACREVGSRQRRELDGLPRH